MSRSNALKRYLFSQRTVVRINNPFTVLAQDAQVSFQMGPSLDRLITTSDGLKPNWRFTSNLGIEKEFLEKTNPLHTWIGTTNKKIEIGFPDGNWARVTGAFNLFGKQVKGAIDPVINEMVNLTTEVNFYANQMTGSTPNVSGLTKIKIFNVGVNTTLTGTLHPSVWNLPMVELIDIRTTGLTGSIPNTLTCAKLKTLEANQSALSGTIPKEFWQLPDLETVNANGVVFTGNLDYLNEAKKLKKLQAQNANFSGSLPNCTGMTVLDYISISGIFTGGLFTFLSTIPRNITLFYIGGSSVFTGQYVVGSIAGIYRASILLRSLKFSQTDVDNILLDALNNCHNLPSVSFSIDLSGGGNANAVPSATGLAAKNEMITTYGLSILTN